MKRTLLTSLAIIGILSAGFFIARAEEDGGPGGHGCFHHGGGFGLEHFAKTLNLTPEQKAKVQPIFDQAKPQIVAIHQEAMQKTHAIMDNAMTQIRPMLTPEQQKKADDMRKAHEDMLKAMKEMHDVHAE